MLVTKPVDVIVFLSHLLHSYVTLVFVRNPKMCVRIAHELST